MTRLLIISDNVELVKFIKCLEEKNIEKSVVVEYRYSVVNKDPVSLKEIGMESIDLKSEEVVLNIINDFDLVISAHCKQIFPKLLVENVRCINVHPGLNPYNRGWYPQVFSIINKLPIGCTIHEMDEDIDHGNIIYQKTVSVLDADTSLDVYNKVQIAEKELLGKNINNIIFKNYHSTPMSESGNYNGIEDFNKLCNLDRNNYGTLGEHIDLLRSLSHGSHQNAFFLDESGEKIYVQIMLTKV